MAFSGHAVSQEVHDSLRRWHGMERGVSVITSHDTLSSYCATTLLKPTWLRSVIRHTLSIFRGGWFHALLEATNK
jgi:hypothetical protein